MEPITITSLVSIGAKLIDKMFPDPAERDKAKLELMKMERDGDLEEVKVQLSAIIAEAQSPDPWTSRARPSFLYVVYILLLWSLPMGVLFAINPDAAARFTDGFKAWMNAIPEPVLTLFGTVMLGYVISRGYEKTKGIR